MNKRGTLQVDYPGIRGFSMIWIASTRSSERITMRSPARKYRSLWLGCLLFTLACGPVFAAGSGEVTGVRLELGQRRIVISTKGIVGKSLAHVIGRPNRLVMDFENMTVGKVPREIKGDRREIYEIRVGNHKSRARLVVDFQNNPVPAYQIRPACSASSLKAFFSEMPWKSIVTGLLNTSGSGLTWYRLMISVRCF